MPALSVKKLSFVSFGGPVPRSVVGAELAKPFLGLGVVGDEDQEEAQVLGRLVGIAELVLVVGELAQ